jgi:alpha-mannosidase
VSPRLYGRAGAIHITTDGSEPTLQSPVVSGAISLAKTATVKAAAEGRGGALGPSASATIEVNDTTAPSIRGVAGLFEAPRVKLEFSEPLGAGADAPAHYSLEPALAVKTAALGADRRSVTLTLESAPKTGQAYLLKVSGVADVAGNTLGAATAEFTVAGPVYSLAEVGAEQRGKAVRDVPGLPVKAGDAWTINLFVRTQRPPASHTVFAGFGRCAGNNGGAGRYLCKFAEGVHFWSDNRDVRSKAPIDLNRWQMLTATCDGSVVRLYKDGRKIGEQAVSLADDDNVVWIAPTDPWEKKYQFEGEIRDFTIWGTALAPESIETLKASAKLP